MIIDETHSTEIVRRLKEELNPERIYLFGSRADGRASAAGSDIDLCVIVPDDEESSYRKAVRAYRSLRGLRVPKDIIVRHHSRFRARAGWASSVEHEVAAKGKVIYSR